MQVMDVVDHELGQPNQSKIINKNLIRQPIRKAEKFTCDLLLI